MLVHKGGKIKNWGGECRGIRGSPGDVLDGGQRSTREQVITSPSTDRNENPVLEKRDLQNAVSINGICQYSVDLIKPVSPGYADLCRTIIKHTGNSTNIRTNLPRHHLSAGIERPKSASILHQQTPI